MWMDMHCLIVFLHFKDASIFKVCLVWSDLSCKCDLKIALDSVGSFAFAKINVCFIDTATVSCTFYVTF